MATRNYHQPKIKQVLALSGPQSGNAVNNAEGGTVLWIRGTNFGEDPALIHVLFGENSVSVLPILFSNTTLAVQAPVLPSASKTINLLIGETSTSEPIEFYLTPGINPEYAGSAVIDLYNMMDAYAFLLGRAAKLAPISPARRLLMDVSINYLNGARTSARQSLNMLMQWQQYQPQIKQAPIRTLEFTDNIIREGGMVKSITSMIDLTIGPGGWLGPVIKKTGIGDFVGGLIDDAEDLFDDFTEEIGSIFKKASDFIEEHTKLFDGLENSLKIATPSLSAAIPGGEAGVDVSFSSGEAFSAAVRGIDAIGQIFGQDVPDPPDPLEEIKEAINKLEAKADTQGSTLSGIKEDLAKQEVKSDRITEHVLEVKEHLDKLEEKADVVETKLDRSEEKQDRQEEKLDIIETKLDRVEEKQDRQEEKLDVLEAKADRQESKLDRLEEKADIQEMKLDKLEGKADRQEGKLDRLEEKTDKQEMKLDKLEGKADRQEEKLDRLEEKTDKQEMKLDKLEDKADRQEGKLDRLEEKADKQEKKLDRLEGKADRQEGKIDHLEHKADIQERKLDKQEMKLDRLEKKNDMQEKKLDKLESKADRQEKKLDKLEGKADRQEGKLDKIEEKLDRLNRPLPTSESSIASQRGGNDNISASIAAIKAQDNKVYMKFAINIGQDGLNQPGAYTQWIDFDRPANAARLVAVSIDLQYEDGSNNIINGLLTVRDETGKIYQRSLKDAKHQFLKNPNKWTKWNQFPGQP